MMDDRLKQEESTTSLFIEEIGEDLHAKHFAEICRVLELLEKYHFVADPKKCKLFVKEV
jgi:hypothetical protein